MNRSLFVGSLLACACSVSDVQVLGSTTSGGSGSGGAGGSGSAGAPLGTAAGGGTASAGAGGGGGLSTGGGGSGGIGDAGGAGGTDGLGQGGSAGMPACLDLGAIALWTVAAPPELSSTVIVDMKVGPGGIVALGQSSSAVAVASLAASDGHTAWARAFPTGPWGVGPHALPTLDGAGAVVVLGMVGAHTFDGTTIDTGPGGFAIVRLDGNGHVVWGHTLGQLPGVWQTTLARVPGGPLMIAGTMDPAATTTASLTFGPFSLPAAAKTGFLVTIDDDGTYGSAVTPAAAPTALVPADGGAFAWIGGKNQSFGKLTSAGDLAWSVAAPDVSAVAMIGPDPLLGQAWSPQGVLVRLSSSTGAPVWSLPVAGMGPVDLRTDLTATGDVLSTAVDYGPYTNYPRLHLSRVSPSGALVYHHTTTTCAALQGAPTLVAEGQALVVTPQKPGLSFSLIAL